MPGQQAKLSAAERRKIAEDFIASAQWKFLDSRGTSATAGEATRVNLRVFAKGCPMHALREVHEALARQRTVTDPLIGQTLIPGTWHHKTSLWSKDERTGESGQATYTILRIFGDGTDTESNVVEDGCGSRTTIRFEWDAASVESIAGIAHSGEQGYSVSIGGVSRDPETNLFNYYVTTTERKTQLVPEYAAGDGAFSTEYDAAWLGLRGTTAAPTDDDGAAVAVLDPTAAAVGDTVGVSWDRSLEDCTLNARGKRARAKRNVTRSQTTSKDLYSIESGTVIAGAVSPLAAAPEPAGGVTLTRKSDLREDRLYDTTEGSKTEREVLSARVAIEDDAFQTRATVVNRSTATAAPAASASGGVIVVPTVEKTPGNLTDVTVVTVTEKTGSRGATSAQDNFSAEASVDDVSATPLGDAPAAAAGVITTHVDKPTPGGLYERKKATRTEKVGARGASKAKTAFEIEETTEDVSATPLGDPPEPSGGVVTSHDDTNTPGGLVQRRKRVKTERTGVRSVAAAATIFSTEAKTEAVAAAAASGGTAGGGVITDASSDATPGGLRRNVTVIKTEVSVPLSSVTERKTPWYTVRTEKDTHAAAPHTLGSTEYATAEYDRSPGGLYNRSKSTVTGLVYGAVLSHSKSVDFFVTTEVTETIAESMDVSGAVLVDAGLVTAHIHELSFRRHEDGYWIKTETVLTPRTGIAPLEGAGTYTRFSTNPGSPDVSVSVTHSQFVNITAAEAQALIALTAIDGVTADVKSSFSMSVNKFGLYSGSFRREVGTEA